jgi:hypothetical protein
MYEHGVERAIDAGERVGVWQRHRLDAADDAGLGQHAFGNQLDAEAETVGEAQVEQADFLDAARRANLMGIVDNFLLFRCVQIVRRLAERDRRVGVFCNIAPASLEDPALFPLLLQFMTENRDLSGSVILELTADKFDSRSPVMRSGQRAMSPAA